MRPSAHGPGHGEAGARWRLWQMSLLLGALASCYKPAIGEGDFICGPNGACPVGFKCLPDNRCYRNPSGFDAGATGGVGAGGTMGTGGAGGAGGSTSGPPDAAACFAGLSCSAGAPPGQACDPVCQIGCGCQQKCVVANGPPMCVPLPEKPEDIYATCQLGMDSCRAGSLCTGESNPMCGSHCYRACRSDQDCGGVARCSETFVNLAGTVLSKVCGQKIDGCNPTGLTPECSNAGPGSRPFPLFGCYILEPGRDDATGCDCAGTIEGGQLCEGRHSCKPGLECLEGPGGERRCRRLCTLAGSGLGAVPCALPTQTCRPIGTSERFGACI
jgi:hypothetical protein